MTARDLAGRGRLYSGYYSVTGFRKRIFKVVASPFTNALNHSMTRSSLCLRQNECARSDDVQQGSRTEHFPPGIHELIVSDSGEGCAKPDECKNDDPHLERLAPFSASRRPARWCATFCRSCDKRLHVLLRVLGAAFPAYQAFPP